MSIIDAILPVCIAAMMIAGSVVVSAGRGLALWQIWQIIRNQDA